MRAFAEDLFRKWKTFPKVLHKKVSGWRLSGSFAEWER